MVPGLFFLLKLDLNMQHKLYEFGMFSAWNLQVCTAISGLNLYFLPGVFSYALVIDPFFSVVVC